MNSVAAEAVFVVAEDSRRERVGWWKETEEEKEEERTSLAETQRRLNVRNMKRENHVCKIK